MSFHHIFQGTVRPVQTFDPEAAADALEKAMKGRGCDKNKVMQIIVGISNGQRQLIREPFKVNFGRDLIETLKKELSGDFEDVIIGLMETPIRYDAIQLKSAMKGLGTRESTLIDILCSRTNAEIEAIKKEYKAEFGTTLEDDIKGDTSGDFQYLLVSLLQAKRDTSYTFSQKQAREDVRLMMGNPAKKEKPDKAQFNAAFCNQNIYQLQKLFSEFQSMIGESIQSVVAKVFSGDAKNAYVLLCDSIESKPRFFSRQLYDAMKGAGTRDKDLIRIIVSRSEIDLGLIREEFAALYKKPLIEWLKAECSGAYRDALIALVNGN